MKSALAVTLALSLAACSGGGGGADSGCAGGCQAAAPRLEVADVQAVIAQAVAEAQARDAHATVAVVDRTGNVLAVFRMDGADTGIAVGLSALPGFESKTGGLEGIDAVPDTLAAIAKAITAAYLSSEGNAFTTRTASQIVQEFFNPGEENQPGGPLFGVQFSSLPCSDLNRRFDGAGPSAGPQRSPLGLSADPGGFPLYKDGALVGGVGAIADGIYAADPDLRDRDDDVDEHVALAGTFGFAPPRDRRADHITVDGKTLRYSDAGFGDLASDPASAPPFDTLAGVGALQAVPGYAAASAERGTAFGFAGSGFRDADDMPVASTAFAGLDAFVLVDASESERFAPRAGTDGGPLDVGLVPQPLAAVEVREVLRGAIAIANRARAQIRRPLNTPARVTVSVVDTLGSVLGVVRTRDAPVFGTDVSLQKARAAAFFSGVHAADDLLATPATTYFDNSEVASIAGYVAPLRDAFGRSTLLADGAIAFGDRSIGNLARPFFPDGIAGTAPGPLSKPIERWSPFSTGLQLDLANDAILQHVLFVLGLAGSDVAPGACTRMPDAYCEANPTTPECTDADRPATLPPPSRLANGLQIFAGSVPIYRGTQLVGAIGISGDGIDQDDMIAFLGLHDAGVTLAGSIGNAPPALRADAFSPDGVRLRYVQCPQAPFLDGDTQRPCEGK